MDGFLLILVLALGAACWWLWDDRQKSVKQRETLQTSFYHLQGELRNKQSQLQLVTTRFDQQQEEFSSTLDRYVGELDRVMLMFPYIEDVNSLLTRMSPKDIASLDLPFGREFSQSMTQIAAQKGEAIARLNEGGLKLALMMHYIKMSGVVTGPSIRLLAEVLKEMRQLAEEYAPELMLPGFKEELARILVVSVNRLRKAYLSGDEQPNADEVARWTQAIDEIYETATFDARAEYPGDELDDDVPFPFSDNGRSASGRHEE